MTEDEALLEQARSQFQTTLVGSWSDDPEYGPWPKLRYEFYPDGTGLTDDDWSQGQDICWFEWRNAGPQRVEIRFKAFLELDANRLEEIGDEETEPKQHGPDQWRAYDYDFKVVDYWSKRVVLVWTSDHLGAGSIGRYAHYFYHGALTGTAPGREHFLTPP
jgi:hypothetical protein